MLEVVVVAAQITAYTVAAVVGLAHCPFYQEYQAQQAEPDPPAVVEAAETDAEAEADAPEIVIVAD